MRTNPLPPIGDIARTRLEDDAVQIGLDALYRTDGKIADALYEVYMAFRDEYGEEARQLEHEVSGRWTTVILRAYGS